MSTRTNMTIATTIATAEEIYTAWRSALSEPTYEREWGDLSVSERRPWLQAAARVQQYLDAKDVIARAAQMKARDAEAHEDRMAVELDDLRAELAKTSSLAKLNANACEKLRAENERLTKATEDAVQLAASRMSPDTYWRLMHERDTAIWKSERLDALLTESVFWIGSTQFRVEDGQCERFAAELTNRQLDVHKESLHRLDGPHAGPSDAELAREQEEEDRDEEQRRMSRETRSM